MVHLNYQTEPETGMDSQQLYKLMITAMLRYIVVMIQQVILTRTMVINLFQKKIRMVQIR